MCCSSKARGDKTVSFVPSRTSFQISTEKVITAKVYVYRGTQQGPQRGRKGVVRMELDDEDPEWLEACMLAVDSLPVANLDAASKTSAVPNSSRPNNSAVPMCQRMMRNNASSSSSNSVAVKGQTSSVRRSSLASSFPAPSLNRMGAPIAASVDPSVKGGGGHTTASSAYPGVSSRPPTERVSGGGTSTSTASWKREGPRTLTSKAREVSRRFRGVGVNVRSLMHVL